MLVLAMIFNNKYKEPLSEKELIEGCIKKKVRCEKQLYDLHAPTMFTVCLRYAGDYHLAQDILQDGFVRVFQNLHQFRFQGSFEGWIRRIMVSTALRHLKSRMRVVSVENAEVDEKTEQDNMLGHLSAQELMNVIQTMPSGYRTVFNMYVLEQMSHKEIGDMLEIGEGTSKSQLAKARKFLQEKINSLNSFKLATHA